MSNISELANVPQISFIENMTLQETEEQLKAEYARIYREQTGKELVLGEADAKTLLLKAFALIEYQTMQYADIKGQAELLKTSTGEALDALVALLGLTRQESKKATAKERFLLAEARADTVAVPAGTRVKTQGGRYFKRWTMRRYRPAQPMWTPSCRRRRPERRAAAYWPGKSTSLLTPSHT